jgi:hypothetical protein
MSKSDAWEDGLLNLLFNNDDFLLVGDGGGLLGSVADGDLYVSLHTADPADVGDQNTSETAYTGYLRIAVSRVAGWSAASAGVVTPAADIDFDECTASPGAAVGWFGIGCSSGTGAGKLLYSGALTPPITMATGVIPRVKSTSTITED